MFSSAVEVCGYTENNSPADALFQMRGTTDIGVRSKKLALKIGDPDDMALAESMLAASDHLLGNHLAAQLHCESGLRYLCAMVPDHEIADQNGPFQLGNLADLWNPHPKANLSYRSATPRDKGRSPPYNGITDFVGVVS